MSKLAKRAAEFSRPYRVTKGKGFRLADVDPRDTGPLESEDADRAREALGNGIELLAELQDKLYAQDRWSVLLIFQAMYNCLKRAGITKVGEVLERLQKGKDEILAIRNFGQKSLDELMERLQAKGYLDTIQAPPDLFVSSGESDESETPSEGE